MEKNEITIKVKKPTKEELEAVILPLIPQPVPGEKGDTYTLTEADKKEIASKVEVPVVDKVIERVIEKTEVIREKPTVTEITKVTNEIREVAVKDTPEETKEKILKIGITYEEIKDTPDIEKLVRIHSQASKTVSIGELDNVDVSHTQTEGSKYILGNSWDKPYGSATFTYDIDGNIETKLIGDTELTYAYDVDGNVESITNGIYTKSFVYNVDGDVEAINYS